MRALDCATVVEEVRHRAPLVHCLTAAVSMNLVADATLAAGARPMMTETEQEAPFVVRRADALLANLGTLSTDGMAGIPATVRVAVERGIPWVLDPAAIGPSPVRVELARELLAQGPTLVRANASEVLVLAGAGSGGRGADASDGVDEALPAALDLARHHGCVVAVSGEVDLVTDGSRVVHVANGHPMLTRVTGTGCALGALSAACLAVTGEPLEAAVTATVWMGLAGQQAAGRVRGPGSFRAALLDELYALTPDEIAAGALIEETA